MLEDQGSDDRTTRDSLRRIFAAAIISAAPAPAVVANLPEKPRGRCVVIGSGKAAAAMAAAVDAAWPDVDLSGIVSTRYGHAVPAGRIRVIEAGHPVPDRCSEMAARQVLAALSGLQPEDLVIALISGGGSATLALPIEGLRLEEKQSITRQLLASGATIGDINTVRRHLSQVKGGKLAAAAAPASLLTLLISDVPGNDPASIASGPTIVAQTTGGDALTVLDRYQIAVAATVRRYLESAGASSAQPGNYKIIANPAIALTAAAREARDLGFNPVILGDCIEGESREVAKTMAGIARSVLSMGEPGRHPAALLSGGETTVTMDPECAGHGGRNTEFLLALALELRADPRIWALAGDSDGIDGTEDAAGAIVTPDTLSRSDAAGLDPHAALRSHDSYSFFRQTGDLVMTGPTLTNVNDIRIIIVS